MVGLYKETLGTFIEIPSIEGEVFRASAKFWYGPGGGENTSLRIKLKDKKTDNQFLLEPFPFRINIGERIRIYSEDLYSKKSSRTLRAVELEVISLDNESVTFQASQKGYHFRN